MALHSEDSGSTPFPRTTLLAAVRARLPAWRQHFDANVRGAWREGLGLPETPYARRWYIEDRTRGSLRLHHWLTSDDHRAPHDHKINFISIILWGSYEDCTPIYAASGEQVGWRRERRGPGSIVRRRAQHRHYVRVAPGGCWSLLITGPEIAPDVGFWVTRDKRVKSNKYFFKYGHHTPDGSPPRRSRKVTEGHSQSGVPASGR